ncbi:hypothetical protein ACHAXR_007742 [Thalassiosira sp. AJA248-18]
MSWELPPLHRHLSTVGIGPVFVCPPPHALPSHPDDEDPTKGGNPASSEVSSSSSSSLSQQKHNKIDTWEIVGAIKSTPGDFIVREIGWAPPSSSVERVGGVENDTKQRKSGEHGNVSEIKYSTSKYRKSPGWSRKIAGMDMECEFISTERSSTKQTASVEKNEGESNQGPFCDNVHFTEKSAQEPLIDGGEDGIEDQLPTANQEPNVTQKARTSDGETEPLTLDRLLNSTAQLPAAFPQSKSQSDATKSQDGEDLKSSVDPTEGLRRILFQCHQHNNQNANEDTGEKFSSQKEVESAADAIMKQLTDLQTLALEEIGQKHAAGVRSVKIDEDLANNQSTVWISTAQLFHKSPALQSNGKEHWKLLHRYLRQAFPILRTESSSVGPLINRNDGGNDKNSGAKEWVCALIDYTFFPIVPYLSNPLEDLLLLYSFRNYGPTPALTGGGARNMSRSKHRKRPQKYEIQSQEEQPGEKGGAITPQTNNNSKGLILLRLRPDLPRSERRVIHQNLASSRRREFETSTEHDVSIDYADNNSKKTTAIGVQWSRNAIQTSQKKRKRIDESGNSNNLPKRSQSESTSNITAIFCVLRKDQAEHQVAINNVVRALRCRSGDIGLAGIKDMQAITYQFCTIRNVGLKKAQRANDSLGKRVQLSNFVEVQDFLIDRGKLLGNRFEIIIRNLKRVQRLHTEGEESLSSSWKERTIPVHASLLDASVKRISDFGFINFYGEQRVGDAGLRGYTGVRSFDVGRAMLQRDFTKAIDLIMTGRSNMVYSPGPEEINAREVWKTSGGDARATLKAFPQNRSTLVRERDLMRGLLRYGDALEALRCVSHNVRMFWIHGYQSFVWNWVATERVRKWGLRPVIGDLAIHESNGEDGAAGDIQLVNDPSKVDISQIVLPLPGYNIEYPSNEMRELYRKILDADGVKLDVKDNVPEATAKGSYRRLIQRATGLKWDIVCEQEEAKPESSGDPVVSAARFTFDLDSGCYATMMLRELMVSTLARSSKNKQ